MKQLTNNNFTTDSLVVELEQTVRYLFFKTSKQLSLCKQYQQPQVSTLKRISTTM